MKILYCLTETYNSGGTEKIVIAKANELAKRGHTVVIATVDQQGQPDFFKLHQSIRRIDLDINYMQRDGGNIYVRKLKRERKKRLHRKLMTDLLFREKFDVVISTFGNEMYFLPKINDGSRKILEIHNTHYFRMQDKHSFLQRQYDKFLTRKDEQVIKNFDAFVCLTHRDSQCWPKSKNLHVIHNFSDTASPEPPRLKSKRIMAAGRLNYQKGYDRMVAAWALVQKVHPEWHLDIFGHGPLREQILRQIKLTGIGNSITIHEPVSNILSEYRASSALILTSHFEGLPMVLLEGLSCGLPLVAFDIDCGPSDLIDDGKNGFLIPDGDIEGFAEAICRLIESEEMRQKMGAASLAKAAQFSTDKIIDKWEELFQRVQLES